MQLLLPINLTNDNGGRSAHWSRAASRKKRYAAVVPRAERRFEVPVEISICRVLGPRQKLWDADSVGRGSVKELIDTLVDAGYLHDDGPRWVRAVQYRQQVDREKGPAVVVEFREATDDGTN